MAAKVASVEKWQVLPQVGGVHSWVWMVSPQIMGCMVGCSMGISLGNILLPQVPCQRLGRM